MNTFTLFPTIAPAIEAPAHNPFHDLWARVGKAYTDPFQHNAQEIWSSSVRIVNEHAARAIVNATQECMAALTQNAAGIQQRSFQQLWGAHQEAMSLFTDAYTRALTGGFRAAP